MACALSKTVTRCSLGKRRSLTAVPAYPTLSMSIWPAYKLSNLVIMLHLLMWVTDGRRRHYTLYQTFVKLLSAAESMRLGTLWAEVCYVQL
jgi:hypothetical protein